MLSFFIVNWRQHAVVRMLAAWVVKHLDVIKHVLPCRVARKIRPSPDPLAFQELEEALCDSIIRCLTGYYMLEKDGSCHVCSCLHPDCVCRGTIATPCWCTENPDPLPGRVLRSNAREGEWTMTVCFGLRRQTALSRACKARSVVIRDCIEPVDRQVIFLKSPRGGQRHALRTDQSRLPNTTSPHGS